MEIIKEKFNDNSIWRLAVNSEGLLVMKLLGLFHDIAEDVSQYKNKENDIINDFNSIVRAELKQWMVNSLTFNLEVLNKNRHKNYFEFILAIKKAGLFSTEVKLADLKHNMSDLEEGSLKDKYRLAEYILTH